MGAGGGALADDDVELVVLEGGVEFFFEDGLEAVDLVEEEDLAVAEVGEDGGEVALDLEGGAGGLLEGDVELVGDDGGEGGFAEAGRAEEEDVVEGFAAGFGGFEGDSELLFGFGLADEFLEAAGAELELEGGFSSSERAAETRRSGSSMRALGAGGMLRRSLSAGEQQSSGIGVRSSADSGGGPDCEVCGRLHVTGAWRDAITNRQSDLRVTRCARIGPS